MTRNIPTQKRAHKTRATLLRASLEAIEAVGRDRFTTAMTAERSGCSIGTVYNYFVDRVDIIETLFPNRVEGLGEVDKEVLTNGDK